ncbi:MULTISPECIES: ATP-binding protein [unclassified Methylobacterium]|jgi:hypothetical protein|uniref:ATP-binding protein n=1 Tax=unclassified Methylobacterium TaxID=2615210 RepID=UPI000A41D678|nr:MULTISPECIES: ATP-binding protein [unclassified Methylobacterium]
MTDQKIDWNEAGKAAELDAFMVAVGHIHVPTTNFDQGVRELEWLRRRARRGEGSCLVVGGRSGSGKSWLLERNLLASEFTQDYGPLVDPLPVISIDAPSPGHTKALAARLLEKVLGYAVPARDSEPMLLDRFTKIGIARGLKVIKIDEFQHVVNSFVRVNQSRNEDKEKIASENIKTQINKAPFQWIIAGEPSVMSFFHRWEQFEGRGRKLAMQPFAWPTDKDELAAFLDKYDEELSGIHFGRKSGLAEMAPRFQLATGGFYGQMVRRLLKDAAEMAFMAGDPDISEALSVTYERWKRLGDRENPFLMKMPEVASRLCTPPTSLPVPTVPQAEILQAAVAQPKMSGRGKGQTREPSFAK